MRISRRSASSALTLAGFAIATVALAQDSARERIQDQGDAAFQLRAEPMPGAALLRTAGNNSFSSSSWWTYMPFPKRAMDCSAVLRASAAGASRTGSSFMRESWARMPTWQWEKCPMGASVSVVLMVWPCLGVTGPHSRSAGCNAKLELQGS